jgi:hypothetical protein
MKKLTKSTKTILISGFMGIILGNSLTAAFYSGRLSKAWEETRQEKENTAIQRRLRGAEMDLLWLVYKQSPKEYWKYIQTTQEYHDLDSLQDGDWEDFYLDEEPSIPIEHNDSTYELTLKQVK